MRLLKLSLLILFSTILASCSHQMVFFKKPDVHNVYFANNSSDLDNKADNVIKTVASKAKNAKYYKVKAYGLASQTGDKDYNKQLSRDRAMAVKEALVNQGLEEENIRIAGLGEDDDPDHKWKDRRVTIKLRTLN